MDLDGNERLLRQRFPTTRGGSKMVDSNFGPKLGFEIWVRSTEAVGQCWWWWLRDGGDDGSWLVDFECWKAVLSRSEKSSGAIINEGVVCILPNSLEGRHLDAEGNIYAFGILLLEVVSGRPPYCKDKGCLVDWAKEFLEMPDAMSRSVDPELKHFRQEDLRVIYEVVKLCLHPGSSTRTFMREVCSMFESGITHQYMPSSIHLL
ncbi:hypothetical protein OROMI_019218 [Orobanche minor]